MVFTTRLRVLAMATVANTVWCINTSKIYLSAAFPMINYYPSRYGPPSAGWGGFNSTMVGASLSLGWYGTEVQMFGYAASTDYTVWVDGKQYTSIGTGPGENVLAHVTGLAAAWHVFTLNVTGTGGVDISGPALNYTFDYGTAEIVAPDYNYTLGLDLDRLQLLPGYTEDPPGSWTNQSVANDVFQEVVTSTFGASLNYPIPPSSFIGIGGSASSKHGWFTVLLVASGDTWTPLNQTFSAYSPGLPAAWEQSHDMFLSPLDSTKSYTLTITCWANATQICSFSQINLVTANAPTTTVWPSATSSHSTPSNSSPISSSSSSSTPTGTSGSPTSLPAVVGGAVGGAVILGLIVYFLWFLRRRNRKRTPRHGKPKSEMLPYGQQAASTEFEITPFTDTVLPDSDSLDGPERAPLDEHPVVSEGSTSHEYVDTEVTPSLLPPQLHNQAPNASPVATQKSSETQRVSGRGASPGEIDVHDLKAFCEQPGMEAQSRGAVSAPRGRLDVAPSRECLINPAPRKSTETIRRLAPEVVPEQHSKQTAPPSPPPTANQGALLDLEPEEDAGRMDLSEFGTHIARPPPTYNPAWAEEPPTQGTQGD